MDLTSLLDGLYSVFCYATITRMGEPSKTQVRRLRKDLQTHSSHARGRAGILFPELPEVLPQARRSIPEIARGSSETCSAGIRSDTRGVEGTARAVDRNGEPLCRTRGQVGPDITPRFLKHQSHLSRVVHFPHHAADWLTLIWQAV